MNHFLQRLFDEAYEQELKQLMVSLFALLVAVVIGYFYLEARKNPSVKKENLRGLFFLTLAFFFIFVLGVSWAISLSDHLTTLQVFRMDEAQIRIMAVLLSGCINICFLLSLPFFSKGVTGLDQLATHWAWFFVVGQVVLLYGLTIGEPIEFKADVVIGSLTLLVLGIYLVNFFIRAHLNFIGLLVGLFMIAMIGLQISAQAKVDGGKFSEILITILYPILFLSMIILIVIFNWANEIRFKELAHIYTEGVDKELIEKYLDEKISKQELQEDWSKDITANQLESVIEEMIMIAERQNANLEMLLTLASRNSRNNNAFYVNGTLSKDDYNRERNQITAGVLHLVRHL